MSRDYSTKNIKLRKCLFGFKKKDVIHYFEKLNETAQNEHKMFLKANSDAEKMYNDIQCLTSENNYLKDELNKRNNDLVSASSALNEKERKISELNTKFEGIVAENSKLALNISQLKIQLEEVTNKKIAAETALANVAETAKEPTAAQMENEAETEESTLRTKDYENKIRELEDALKRKHDAMVTAIADAERYRAIASELREKVEKKSTKKPFILRFGG